MKEVFIQRMIDDYEQLVHIPKESYELVSSRLSLVRKNQGQIIKAAGQIDRMSRYICDGFIGYYSHTSSENILFAIHQSSDTVFDLDSYRTGIPSATEIKAISDVSYLEFSIQSEKELLGRDPHLMRLALAINQRIIKRQANILKISKMGFDIGYPILIKEFKGIGNQISNQDLATFFNLSVRSLIRHKTNLK
jgi:hypothetical protein